VVKTTALTTSGLLRGQEEAGVVVFRGVPYATCDRFCPPVPVAAWEGLPRPMFRTPPPVGWG
jgi:para-nitrobenzyl esterase